MEKTSFVNNGVLRLPPGFRFHPTDKEFVVQYLKRKVYPFPLQSSLMSMSASDLEQGRYFFSTKEAKYPNGNCSNRSTLPSVLPPVHFASHRRSPSASHDGKFSSFFFYSVFFLLSALATHFPQVLCWTPLYLHLRFSDPPFPLMNPFFDPFGGFLRS
ncbi:NAC domain-containing protein 83 [Linum perenne]